MAEQPLSCAVPRRSPASRLCEGERRKIGMTLAGPQIDCILRSKNRVQVRRRSCGERGFVVRAPVLAVKPAPHPWGVELVGGPTDATALLAYRRMQEKYASILGGREPLIVHHGLGRGSMGWAHARVGADNRSAAEKLCANLRAAGVIYCEVQRNGAIQPPRLRVRAMWEARPGRAPSQSSD